MDRLNPVLIIHESDLDLNVTMNVSGFLENNVQFFYVPGIACTGIIINVIVLFLTLKRSLLKPTYTPLIILLSISDAGFLLILLLSWMSKNYILNIYSVSGVCQIVVFTSHLFGFVSSWIVVALVTMRFCFLLQPYKFARTCTPTVSRLLVSVFMVFTFTAYLYKTWTHGTMETFVGPFCTVIPENESAMRLLSIIDVLLIVVVPCVFIIIMQISIIVCVLARIYGKDRDNNVIPVCTYVETGISDTEGDNREHREENETGMRDESQDVDVSTVIWSEMTDIFMEPMIPNSHQDEREASSTDRVTFSDRRMTRDASKTHISVEFTELDRAKWKKTLAFSLSFICLVLPGAVEKIVFMLGNDKAFSDLQKNRGSTHQLFQMMFYTHFALDGIIYVFLSRTFWRAFRKVQ